MWDTRCPWWLLSCRLGRELWLLTCFGFDMRVSPESYVFSVPGGADDNLIEGGEMKFVCKPGARNITVIFQPLLRYGDTPEHTGRKQNAPNETDEGVVLRRGAFSSAGMWSCLHQNNKSIMAIWHTDTNNIDGTYPCFSLCLTSGHCIVWHFRCTEIDHPFGSDYSRANAQQKGPIFARAIWADFLHFSQYTCLKGGKSPTLVHQGGMVMPFKPRYCWDMTQYQ